VKFLSPKFLFALLAGVAPVSVLAQTALAPAPTPVSAPEAAAEQPPQPEAEVPDEATAEDPAEAEAIVVTGQRLRGAVDTDIPPEVQLDRRDIRATGAGSISELLEAIAPQTRSGRGREGGGRPVILLNGRRISGFNEIRDLPPEAIERVDIMPEEVALRYGYRPDQRVVNIVLRRRFDATTAELQGGIATAGGRGSYGIDLNNLRIDPSGRTSLDFEYQHADPLLESERTIIQAVNAPADVARFRTLLPETDQLTLGGTVNRAIFGDVSATGNARLEIGSSQSRLGLAADNATPLTRESDSRTAHAGVALNGDIRPWRWAFTGNYDNVRNASRTDRGVDAAGAVTQDRTRSTSSVGSGELVLSGPITDLPAGEISATVRGGFDTRDFSSTTLRSGVSQTRDLSRDRGSLQASIDVPIASRRRAVLSGIGDLSVNANAEIEQLSDFGTLRTFGGGINWSPIEEVNLGATYTNEEGAPSMQQLGDPGRPRLRFRARRDHRHQPHRRGQSGPHRRQPPRALDPRQRSPDRGRGSDFPGQLYEQPGPQPDRLLPDRDAGDRGRLSGPLHPRRPGAAAPDRFAARQLRPLRPQRGPLGDQFLRADRAAGPAAGRARPLRRAARPPTGRAPGRTAPQRRCDAGR
jgi:iron complex outermembrane receptor protein